MCLDLNDTGIHRDLFLDGLREPVATEKVKSLLGKNDVVLEIGANIGYYAMIEAQLCKKVYAVEPVPSNVEFLRKNIELNGFSNIDVYQLAFGSENGFQEILLSDKSNWHSFYQNESYNLGEQSNKLRVKMMCVNEFVKNKEMPTFVKLDVEGYEIEVIKGMQKVLPKTKNIFMEIHSDIMKENETKQLLDIMRIYDFKVDLVIKYDRPGLSKILNVDYIDRIYNGDKGVYEVFFTNTNLSI